MCSIDMKTKRLAPICWSFATNFSLAVLMVSSVLLIISILLRRIFSGTVFGVALQAVLDLPFQLFVSDKYHPCPILGLYWIPVFCGIILVAVGKFVAKKSNVTKRLMAVWSFWMIVLSLIVLFTPEDHGSVHDIIRVIDETSLGESANSVFFRIPARILENGHRTWNLSTNDLDLIHGSKSGMFLAENIGTPEKAITLVSERNISSRICGYLFADSYQYRADLFFTKSGCYCGVHLSTMHSSWRNPTDHDSEVFLGWTPKWTIQTRATPNSSTAIGTPLMP